MLMVRADTTIPEEWDRRLEEIRKKKGNVSRRQLIRDAIYQVYIEGQSGEGK